MKKTRTKHNPAFKAKVALAALRDRVGGRDCAPLKVHANVVYKSAADNAAQSFRRTTAMAGRRIGRTCCSSAS